MSDPQGLTGEQERAALSQRVDELRREITQIARQAGVCGEQVREKAQEAVEIAEQWTREHPLTAVGVSAGCGAVLGFLLGMLVGRK